MKNIYTVLTSIILLLFSNFSTAQQYQINNFYIQNPFVYNPAATGINGNLTAFVDNSDQWTGLKGAPETVNFGVHGLITNAMGVGLQVSQNKQGVFKQTSAALSYSYRVALSEKHTLAMGLSLGLMQNKINIDNVFIPDISDPALNSNKFNEALLVSGFGIHYNWKDLNIGISAPILYGTQETEFMQTILASASYDFFLANDVWLLKPVVFYRYTNANLHLVDINLVAEWNKYLRTQIGYRTNGNIIAGLGLNLKKLDFVYIYEVNRTEINVISTGSHQIMIMFEFPYSVTKKKPLYLRSKRSSWN